MCEQCCQCEWEIGQTVISEMGEQGLICLKCKKVLSWFSEELDEVHVDEDPDDWDEITIDPDTGERRSLEEITEDLIEMGGTGGLFGDAAFFCDCCEEWTFWKGPKETLKMMVSDMRQHDFMHCPSCHEINEITDEAREMLR